MATKRQRNTFYFKKFSVNHDLCTMKVGTDAVLLGAWVTISSSKHVLDVGTGSGVIALMLAQRTDAQVHIDAIEINEVDANQAKENILSSPWREKISVNHASLQEFRPKEQYDLIVSNPPYFVNSLQSPSQTRTQARHNQELTFNELISNSLRLLNPTGRLAVILPFAEGNIFKTLAIENQLHLIRETAFYSRREKPQERWLFEFSCEEAELQSDQLLLYEKDSIQTEKYINLVKDFYL
ncbi:MAG TPA: tRNA (adenosine(37)-N6)-methyltransferase TrmM [Cytophagales bacterium]|jgi:tRNA1Val (adenine37-N6)-methyltransferase|nr:tRNA (adenosine(37)-N6)-methyltransferase TrmM [Cytophagales bacterium]